MNFMQIYFLLRCTTFMDSTSWRQYTLSGNGRCYAAATGGTTLAGNTCRTWYDGISYAKVNPFQIQKVYSSGPSAIMLVWNSPPPEMSLTTPSYTVQKTTSLNPPVTWTTVATGIPATSRAYTTTNVDVSAAGATAFYRVTWP
jgi:hypothetical protein